MKIAFDIGGVLSAYTNECVQMIRAFSLQGHEIHVISDMHPLSEVARVMKDNFSVDLIDHIHVHSSDYAAHGNAAKTVLMRDLGIDIMIDDFMGYLIWPFESPAPLRLLVMPDPRRPYWQPDWVADGSDFGRRSYLG